MVGTGAESPVAKPPSYELPSAGHSWLVMLNLKVCFFVFVFLLLQDNIGT